LLALAALAQIGQYPPYVLFAAVQYLLMGSLAEPLANFYASMRDVPEPPEEAFPSFRAFCLRNEEAIRSIVSTRLVQTNEVGRAACLTPAFASVAKVAGDAPLHLIDVGAAAGLNLLFDRFFIDYGRFSWGDDTSPVRIQCELRSDAHLPLEGWRPIVCHRIGIDLNPIDVSSESDARWLKALVWPERRERAETLGKAMAIASKEPPKLLKGDVVSLLPEVLASVPAGETACVYQSYTLEYFSQEQRDSFHAIMEDFGARRDLYFVEMSGIEPNGSVRLTSWRNGEKQSLRLAECPPHGQWLKWLL
jgi:hypothetical protein